MKTPDVQSPGGIDCPKKLAAAVLLTVLAMARHWRELPAIYRETGARR